MKARRPKTKPIRRRDAALPDKPLFREAIVERATVDADERVAEFSFSSEAPVERMFGLEVLDHGEKSIRLGRLSDGGPVLLDHDPTRQVGVVERVRIADGKGRVQARFSRSTLGQEVFQDIADGIRRNVSVGYRVHKAENEKRSKGGDVVRITDWEPFEVSIVSIPADTDVGVGRSADAEKESVLMEDTRDNIETTETREADVDILVIEDEARKKERERANDIQEIAGKFRHSKKVQVAAQQAVARGETVQSFHERALDLLASDSAERPTELGLTKPETQRYSLMRMLRAQYEAHHHGTPPEKIAPYEYRLHLDQMDRVPAKRADEVRGWLVPYEVSASRGFLAHRAPPADTVENASLVPEDHLADQFIVGLRATSAVMRAGATSLTGLVGDVSIPREESIPVEWLTEDLDATDVDYVTDAVTLTPTTVAGSVPITRRLMKQSSPDVDVVVRNNLVLGIAEEIDKQSLLGTGVGALPTGIRNQPGVLTEDVSTGTGLTWADIVGFETSVEVGSNLIAGGSYIVRPERKAAAKTTSKDAGSGMFIWENNMMNGYPAYSSVHAGADANGIVFGNFANLLIGFWGILDVMMDPYTKAASGGMVVRTFQDVDVAVRRATAFCIENQVA